MNVQTPGHSRAFVLRRLFCVETLLRLRGGYTGNENPPISATPMPDPSSISRTGSNRAVMPASSPSSTMNSRPISRDICGNSPDGMPERHAPSSEKLASVAVREKTSVPSKDFATTRTRSAAGARCARRRSSRSSDPALNRRCCSSASSASGESSLVDAISGSITAESRLESTVAFFPSALLCRRHGRCHHEYLTHNKRTNGKDVPKYFMKMTKSIKRQGYVKWAIRTACPFRLLTQP